MCLLFLPKSVFLFSDRDNTIMMMREFESERGRDREGERQRDTERPRQSERMKQDKKGETDLNN